MTDECCRGGARKTDSGVRSWNVEFICARAVPGTGSVGFIAECRFGNGRAALQTELG